MKKVILFSAALVFINKISLAQTTPKIRKTTPLSTQPISVYSLTSARVNIRTGNDNKEFPSMVYVELWLKDQHTTNYDKACLFRVKELKNEMSVNSNTELGLGKEVGAAEKFTLEAIQKAGLTLRVGYLPNFFMDAWKIEGVTLTLEFRDQNSSLHPTLGTKTITFNNAYGLLNSEYIYMTCITDQSFNALTASIEKTATH